MVGLVAAAALARSFYHLLDRHRVDEAVGFLDDAFRGHGMGSDRTGFRAEASAWFAAFPDLRISIDRLVTDGPSVAARLVLRGTHQGRFAGLSPTGRPIDISGVDVLIEYGGRFVEAWSLRDLNGLWVQLGVLPTPPISPQPTTGVRHEQQLDDRSGDRLLRAVQPGPHRRHH
jgi:predicted ester cyclase